MATRKRTFSSSSSSGNGSSIMPWLGISLIVILLDQVTKLTIKQMFAFGQSRPVTSFFNLVLTFNEGAAFSFLSSQGGWQRYLFTGISVCATILILYLLKRNAGQRMFCWALALILGGAVGNLIDRVAYGHVIDFLDVHAGGWHWPAFNVADSAICLGAVLFVLDELRRAKR